MSTWISTRPNLVIPGVLDTYKGDEAHVTLAYLGDVEHDEVLEVMRSTEAVPGFYATPGWKSEPIVAEISGFAHWRDASNKLFRVALVSPVIPAVTDGSVYSLRGTLMRYLSTQKFAVDGTYPFIPHITLPDRYQEGPEPHPRCQHGQQYNIAVPYISQRTMFNLGDLYVSSVTKDGAVKSFRNDKVID